METDDWPQRESHDLVSKSAHDVNFSVETTPTTRVHMPNTHIRESAHDVNFSVETTPTTRVTAPEPVAPSAPIRPVSPVTRPDVNTGGNATADR